MHPKKGIASPSPPCTSLSHFFELRGSVWAVSGLIDGAPKIKPEGMPVIKALCSSDQDSATAAAHVEDLFVAAELEGINRLPPDAQTSHSG